MNQDAVRTRFAATARRIAELEEQRRSALAESVRGFVVLDGHERALDFGAGTGALAFALAPLVREVVAVDLVPELLEEGRRRAAQFPNVRFVQADGMRLPFEYSSFDLAGTLRTIHHMARPELAIAELARVTRPGGHVLLIDQIAPADPLRAVELDRFERARDPSHTRSLSDNDFRALFEANGLMLQKAQFSEESRDLQYYLDLADCEGEARQRALALAPGETTYTTTLAWYLLVKPSL